MYEIAKKYNVKRVIFSSTITALPLTNEILTENTLPEAYSINPYGWSKASGEKILSSLCNQDALNPSVAIIRIGGIFSDWCELPPISWLINRWSQKHYGRIVPGRGQTGMGYLHRDDFILLIDQILKKHNTLKKLEILLAYPNNITTHNDIFPIIRSELNLKNNPVRIKLHRNLIKLGMLTEHISSRLIGLSLPPEKLWMCDYIDKPIIADPSYTHQLLEWKPSPELDLIKCLPGMITKFKTQKETWNLKQFQRESHNYTYE